MTDISDLPEAFEALRSCTPDGFTLSERVIDPLIVIDRVGQSIVARLAGVRVVRGDRSVHRAPSNCHTWVVDGSTIRPLPRDAASLFVELLRGFAPDNLPYSEAVRLIRDAGAVIAAEPDEAFLRAGRVVAEDLEGEIAVPGLTATLFPYQARGVRWMWETIRHTGGLILADEMGLGKTLQIIALLLMDPPKASIPALIVCPTSLIANWVREFERFAAGMTLMVHRGPNRAGIYRELQKASVVITTYDTMVNDISIFSSFEWSWVICDEAQAIKNPDSNRRRAIAAIPRRRTIPMTGTPVENSLLDLWSLTDFAIPGLLGSRCEFEAAYPDSIESAQAVGRFTDPVILMRRVADVAGDLPERINIDLPLELDDQLAEHYLMVREATLAKYPVAGALVATLQLQLVCAHPWLRRDEESDSDGEDSRVVPTNAYPLMTPKMERAVTLLQEAFFHRRKVIVFALFNRIGDLLKDAFSGFPDAYWGAINGSTPQEGRQTIIDDFSAHNGPGCLVLNPKAAGAGLNITAATVVIHFTPVWNPALEAQASARAHRRGQTQPVTVYRLFYKDTVEEVMIDRSLWKSELANESVPVSSRDATDLKRALEIAPEKI
ncbi:helicase-like protein [Pseudomonas sp. WPR_5_2]|uniref:DEAD/DEAH box helicase n=1 Tax=Pseudomonas sp. WPR_5_2 TaxID=1907371 RepID=UPI000EAF0003|nr:DEAD/DEAH box helicase [Pseudomonas sp. WPR_5_2]RKS12235.1 helicase-like protein [Pseudomonas sp. WPR_5_2]